ncbi:MAG TPA: peroxiredoxin, partial [Lacipirellulaceae bacterium]|nr:peroxiredoxin [Lacipirellulaceae bacterium]
LLLAAAAALAAEDEKPVVLSVGDEAPEFAALDDQGEPWSSIDHVGEKILVIYFYPKDMTSGCTVQACAYRDALPELAEQDVEIIGVSGDTVESHQQFKEKERLNFTLLADTEGKVARAFGVKMLGGPGSVIASRWTFVIDQDGHIAYKNEQVSAAKDAAEVMKVVAALRQK